MVRTLTLTDLSSVQRQHRIIVMPANEIRVGLLWHSLRSGNLGVGALALSNLAIVYRPGSARA